jgi:hypothetical protein
MRKLLIFFLVVTFFSCYKEKKIDVPSAKPSVVVNCIFRPNEVWKADILFSKTPFSEHKENPIIKNALVLILDDSVIVDTLVYVSSSKYIGTTTPKIGKAYKLLCIVPGYDTISASDSIPKHNFENLQVDLKDSFNSSEYLVPNTAFTAKASKIQFKFNEAVTEENFYKIQLALYSTSYFLKSPDIIDSLLERTPELESDNTKLSTDVNINYCLFDDKLLGGQHLESNLYYYHAKFYPGILEWAITLPLPPTNYFPIYFIEFHSMSQALFRYHKSYIAQNLATADLFGEFKNAYSNINKGLGIFAGEQIQRIRIN